VVSCADILMSSITSAFQAPEESSSASHGVPPLTSHGVTAAASLSGDASALDVLQAFSNTSSNANFPEAGVTSPVIAGIGRQSGYIWHSPKTGGLAQSTAATGNPAHLDVIGPGFVEKSQRDVQRVSAADHVPGSAEEVNPFSRLSQYGLTPHQAPDPTTHRSVAALDVSTYGQQNVVGHSVAKRRSLDQPYHVPNNMALTARQPKQRANSLTDNTSAAHGNTAR